MIPLVRPELPGLRSIQILMKESVETGQLSNFGPLFEKCVELLSHRTDMWALPVTNGTAAIQVAVQLNCPLRTTVLVPDFTHIGTLSAVVAAGCDPMLVSCDRSTWTISPQEIEKIPREKFSAFIVVSPFGYKVDFAMYDDLSRKIRKPVIYDLAGGWGLNPKTENPVCYSFHATKNVSCGEGGAVCFNTSNEWDMARRITNFDTLLDRTVASPYGNNLKLDELKCAVILSRLADPSWLTEKIERKKALLDLYQSELNCIPHDLHKGAAPSLCVLSGMKAELIEKESQRRGFVAKKYYIPLSRHRGLDSISRFSQCSPFFDTCVALPSDEDMDTAKKIIHSIREITPDAKA